MYSSFNNDQFNNFGYSTDGYAQNCYGYYNYQTQYNNEQTSYLASDYTYNYPNYVQTIYSPTSTTSTNNSSIDYNSSFFNKSDTTSPSSSNTSQQHQSSTTTKTVKRTGVHHQPLPEEAVDILNDWFDSHINHPYPTTEDKHRLSEQCGITVKQVNSWFCNRRNRSQNTKPKRIKRQLEQEITNVYNELVLNPNKTQVIEKFRSALIQHDIGIKQ